jgi:hypothetical protein
MPKQKVEKPKYTCMCCLDEKNEDDFCKSQWTKLWTYSNKRVLFCKDCIGKLMTEYTNRYGEKTALIICCAILDIPFYNSTYQSIITNNSIFNIGLYIRLLNGRQFQYKAFLNTIVENELAKLDSEVREEREAKWNKSDRQNMNFAISVVGYDPFDDCGMTEVDRKYCFNILAGYCDTEGIQKDGHKIQSVVQITQSQLQCRKMDEMINAELLNVNPDEKKVKELTATKKQLLDSISSIAKDNNLASNYNDNSRKGVNTLSDKMKEMTKDNFAPIQVNLFNIKTAEAMKQIADLSNQSIMEQLTFDANDYTDMIKQQRVIIKDYEEKNIYLEEELRNIKNELEDIKTKKKK